MTEYTKLPVSFKMSVALEQALALYLTNMEMTSPTDYDFMFKWLNTNEDERMKDSFGYVFH